MEESPQVRGKDFARATRIMRSLGSVRHGALEINSSLLCYPSSGVSNPQTSQGFQTANSDDLIPLIILSEVPSDLVAT